MKRMTRVRFCRTTGEVGAALMLRALVMVVYHGRHRFGVRRLMDGFQSTPARCPKCRKTAYRDDLKYLWATPVDKRLVEERDTNAR